MGKSQSLATASLTAQTTGTDHIYVMDSEQEFLRVWITGIAGATIVTVQSTFDDGTTWGDVAAYALADSVNGSVQQVIEDFDQSIAYRIFIKTGEYDSGTVVARIGY